MKSDSKIARCLLGLVLTAALVAFGLLASGHSARALSFFGPASPTGLDPLSEGRQSSEELWINGQRTEVADCWSPRSPGQVLGHYRKQASQETPNTPYLLREDEEGGFSLLWSDPEGYRRAVLAEGDRGGTRYRLLVHDPPSLSANTLLPGAISVPRGLEVAFSQVARDGSGLALFEGPGSGRDLARAMLAELEGRGYQVDPQRQRLIRALEAGGRHGGRLTVPFDHVSGSLGGRFSVTPGGERSRVWISVHTLQGREAGK